MAGFVKFLQSYARIPTQKAEQLSRVHNRKQFVAAIQKPLEGTVFCLPHWSLYCNDLQTRLAGHEKTSLANSAQKDIKCEEKPVQMHWKSRASANRSKALNLPMFPEWWMYVRLYQRQEHTVSDTFKIYNQIFCLQPVLKGIAQCSEPQAWNIKCSFISLPGLNQHSVLQGKINWGPLSEKNWPHLTSVKSRV